MKRIAALTAVLVLASAPARAVDPSTEDAKRQYRSYLAALKQLNEQYKQVTGQIAQVVKDEGLPTWQSSPAEGEISKMVSAAYGDSRVKQSDKEIKVYLELPGLSRSTIKVSLDDPQTLRVKAEKRVADQTSQVDQTVALPVPALEKGAKARYNDGILEITLPKGSPGVSSIPVN